MRRPRTAFCGAFWVRQWIIKGCNCWWCMYLCTVNATNRKIDRYSKRRWETRGRNRTRPLLYPALLCHSYFIRNLRKRLLQICCSIWIYSIEMYWILAGTDSFLCFTSLCCLKFYFVLFRTCNSKSYIYNILNSAWAVVAKIWVGSV